VQIEWIDRVRSDRYQMLKMTVSVIANSSADTLYGTPSPMWIASATMVPNTATIATAVQYGHVRYTGTRNCQTIATANTTIVASTARYGLNRCTRKSDTASPIAVVSSFTNQK
jgi:hypothetical protein